MQHSPAPWWIDKDRIFAADDRLVCQVADGDGVLWNRDLKDLRGCGDCHLIRSAPELLFAFWQLLDAYRKTPNYDWEFAASMDALIDKAVGIGRLR